MNARIALLVALLTSLPASATTLTGELVNGTTGGTGTADRIELIDVAQGMAPISTLDDVEGTFEIFDVPETSAHLLLRVSRGELIFSQNVEQTTAPIVVQVYESTNDLTGIELSRHHVIFRRDAEHMVVTELLEYANTTDPPMTVSADVLPMRFGFVNATHGAPQAQVGSSEFPVTLPVVETDLEGVQAVERALRPGNTRMFVNYAIEYDASGTTWDNTAVYPTEDRRVLVRPADVQVAVDQMIATDSPMEGYASYAGLPIAAESSWSVRMAGGTAMTLSDGHDHGNANAGGVTRVETREHRFADQRILLMVVIAAVLGFGLLLGVSRGGTPLANSPLGGRDKRRATISRLADRYVSGEITRDQFEAERDRVMGKKSKHDANGHANGSASKKTAAHSN